MKKILLMLGLVLLVACLPTGMGCTQIIIEQPQKPDGIPSSVEIKLSSTALNLFLACPYCFWLNKAKSIKRPSGPFSSLPVCMDLSIKKYFDKYRAQGTMPPELKGKVKGILMPDQAKLKKWRHYQSGLKHRDKKLNACLRGGLDECLVDGDVYIVADYKTRGSSPKKEVPYYYQNQLNCYTLLLKENNYETADFAYLIYYILEDVQEDGMAKFQIKPVKVNVDPEAARQVFQEAVKILRNGPPSSAKDCKYCKWRNASRMELQ